MFDNKIVVTDAANDDLVSADVEQGNREFVESSVNETSDMLLSTSDQTDHLEMWSSDLDIGHSEGSDSK